MENGELKRLEEALPRLKECVLEKVSRLYKAKTEVGSDSVHPTVPLDLTKETRGEIVEVLEMVEQSGKWPQQACTTMFFLIPKNVTSETGCADADVDSLVGSIESTRSGKVAAEVPRGLGYYRLPKWRISTNGMGNTNGDGQKQWQSKGRISRCVRTKRGKTERWRCKPRGKGGGPNRTTTGRKEGRSDQRLHDRKKGGKSNKERQTDGQNCKTKWQDIKNLARKRERLERQERKEKVGCNEEMVRLERLEVEKGKRRDDNSKRKKRRTDNEEGGKSKNGWIENWQ